MMKRTRKVLRRKPPKELEEARTDTPVGFRLNPDELRRVQEHLLRASRAAGVEVTLGSYSKAATLAYGDDRRKLADIEVAARADAATSLESIRRILGVA